jgi:hypothetical protein
MVGAGTAAPTKCAPRRPQHAALSTKGETDAITGGDVTTIER